MRVDHDAVVNHELRRNSAHRGSGRHFERRIHVGGQGLLHALEDVDLVLCLFARLDGVDQTGCWSLCRDWLRLCLDASGLSHNLSIGCRCSRSSRGSRGCRRNWGGGSRSDWSSWNCRCGCRRSRTAGGCLVTLQDWPPRLVYGIRICLVLLVHLSDEPVVRTEFFVVVRHSRPPFYAWA